MKSSNSLINWKAYGVLLVASILSVIAIIPYMLTLQGDLVTDIPVPLPMLLFAQLIQNAIIFSVMIFVGLYLGSKVGLGVPYLDKLLDGNYEKGSFRPVLKLSVLLGLGVGILIILLDILFGLFVDFGEITDVSPPIWQGFLASFYGGIAEEVMLRLFLMTLVVWVLNKVFNHGDKKVKSWIIWFSIIFTAILFGLGHLPAVALLTELTPMIIIRTVVLNGVAGMTFGWLYWKKGLESSMIAHFSADIVLHVLLSVVVLMLS